MFILFVLFILFQLLSKQFWLKLLELNMKSEVCNLMSHTIHSAKFYGTVSKYSMVYRQAMNIIQKSSCCNVLILK